MTKIQPMMIAVILAIATACCGQTASAADPSSHGLRSTSNIFRDSDEDVISHETSPHLQPSLTITDHGVDAKDMYDTSSTANSLEEGNDDGNQNSAKVKICHMSNPSSFFTMDVSVKKKELHMKRHPNDKVGPCLGHCQDLCPNSYSISNENCMCLAVPGAPSLSPTPIPTQRPTKPKDSNDKQNKKRKRRKITFCHMITPSSSYLTISVRKAKKEMHMKKYPNDVVGSCTDHCKDLCLSDYSISGRHCSCLIDTTSPPTMSPTLNATQSTPTSNPSKSSTKSPTSSSSMIPTHNPTASPSTKLPTSSPSNSPTGNPTTSPSDQMSKSPTAKPTKSPSVKPSMSPTSIQTLFEENLYELSVSNTNIGGYETVGALDLWSDNPLRTGSLDGRLVGSSSGKCTLLHGANEYMCNGILKISEKGTITYTGLWSNGRGTLAITGGTGYYEDEAQGTLYLTAQGEDYSSYLYEYEPGTMSDECVPIDQLVGDRLQEPTGPTLIGDFETPGSRDIWARFALTNSNNEVVGHSYGVCTLLPTATTLMCIGAWVLNDSGDIITFAGYSPKYLDEGVLAVTGGTGCYAGASATLSLMYTDDTYTTADWKYKAPPSADDCMSLLETVGDSTVFHTGLSGEYTVGSLEYWFGVSLFSGNPDGPLISGASSLGESTLLTDAAEWLVLEQWIIDGNQGTTMVASGFSPNSFESGTLAISGTGCFHGIKGEISITAESVVEDYVLYSYEVKSTNGDTNPKPTTEKPTSSPTGAPTKQPTRSPTTEPTDSPGPLPGPTDPPTSSPTKEPTKSPSEEPSGSPTKEPSDSPTKTPSSSPTMSPSKKPSASPTGSPTISPTKYPTTSPTDKQPPSIPGTDSPTTQFCWRQVGDDISSIEYDTPAGDQGWVGSPVAISKDGKIIAVGAPYNNSNGPRTGLVRTYKWDNSAWTRLAPDIVGESPQWHGSSIALSADGQTLAVGAVFTSGREGRVRVYKLQNDIWVQDGEIDGENSNDTEIWGGTYYQSLALSAEGSVLAVGAPGNDSSATNSGRARVFERTVTSSGTSWDPRGSIDGEAAGDRYGTSVSLSASGLVLAVGAHLHDGGGADSGHVQVYSWDGNYWNQLGADIVGGNANDWSGYMVSLSESGDVLAAGAPGNDVNGAASGQVRAYKWTGNTWDQLGSAINGEAAGDAIRSGTPYLGYIDLSADGTTLAVGAPGNDGDSTNTGRTRVFQWNGASWDQLGEGIQGKNEDDQSGVSVSLSGDGGVLAVGAYWNHDEDDASGHTRIFQFECSRPTLEPTLQPSSSPTFEQNPSKRPTAKPTTESPTSPISSSPFKVVKFHHAFGDPKAFELVTADSKFVSIYGEKDSSGRLKHVSAVSTVDSSGHHTLVEYDMQHHPRRIVSSTGDILDLTWRSNSEVTMEVISADGLVRAIGTNVLSNETDSEVEISGRARRFLQQVQPTEDSQVCVGKCEESCSSCKGRYTYVHRKCGVQVDDTSIPTWRTFDYMLTGNDGNTKGNLDLDGYYYRHHPFTRVGEGRYEAYYPVMVKDTNAEALQDLCKLSADVLSAVCSVALQWRLWAQGCYKLYVPKAIAICLAAWPLVAIVCGAGILGWISPEGGGGPKTLADVLCENIEIDEPIVADKAEMCMRPRTIAAWIPEAWGACLVPSKRTVESPDFDAVEYTDETDTSPELIRLEFSPSDPWPLSDVEVMAYFVCIDNYDVRMHVHGNDGYEFEKPCDIDGSNVCTLKVPGHRNREYVTVTIYYDKDWALEREFPSKTLNYRSAPANTVPAQLHADCDHSEGGRRQFSSTSAFLSRWVTGVTGGNNELFQLSEQSCPYFFSYLEYFGGYYFNSPEYIDVTATKDVKDAVLVDYWKLDIDGDVKYWWANDGGAVCLSDDHDEECWPSINDAEFARKGVRLYRTKEIAHQFNPSLPEDQDWEYILYENGHECKLSSQCESNNCVAGYCVPINTIPFRLNIDCEHSEASINQSSSTSAVLAKFVEDSLEAIEASWYAMDQTESCPYFYFYLENENIHYIDVVLDGDDALLVDSWKLNSNGTVKHWWANDGGAVCLSDDHDEECWSSINDAEFARKGVRLYRTKEIARQFNPSLPADQDWEYILYEKGHECKLSTQCESNYCEAGHCVPLNVVGVVGPHTKLLADDGAARDNFGSAVAVSGGTVVVGSTGYNFIGSVYVFSHDGDDWIQEAKLFATDGAEFDDFGSAVAVSGDIVAVGAPRDDNGSVSVFIRDGDMWIKQAKLLPSDGAASDRFGNAVAVSGDTVVVGAHADDDNGNNSGSAYVFFWDGNTWKQQAKLLPNDGAAADLLGRYFGSSVSVDGDTIVVGSDGDDDNGIESGSAYVFTRDGGTWNQQAKLLANDGQAIDFFGGSVAVSGDIVVVGARGDDDNGSHSGSAYVFNRDGNVWKQQAKLLPSDGAALDEFGYSVAVSGNIIVVGAHYDAIGNDRGSTYVYGNSKGSAYVFIHEGDTWTQQAKLLPNDRAIDGGFGDAVAVGGIAVVVGAPGDDDNGQYSGSAYVFPLQ